MRTNLVLASVCALLGTSLTARCQEPGTRIEVSAAVGQDPVGSRTEGGVQTTITPAGWKAGIEADLWHLAGYSYCLPSSLQCIRVGVPDLNELDVGARTALVEGGRVWPWIGLGIAALVPNGGGQAFGPWVGFGLTARVVGRVTLGLQLHYVSGRQDVYSGDLGGTAGGATLGVAF